jgi:uncharacterized membrane protein
MLESALRCSVMGFELAGAAVIVAVAAVASVLLVRALLAGVDWTSALANCRAAIGRGVLLGLELLVAADILRTVAAPLNLENVLALALVVLIRTFRNLSLSVEIEGVWPWRRRQSERVQPPASR